MADSVEGSIFSWENPDNIPSWYDNAIKKHEEILANKKTEETNKILNETFGTKNEIDEDSYERYIRKVLHKIRNFKISKRLVDIKMNINVYQVLNFDLNGKKLARIIMQVKDNGYYNIDTTKIKDVETTQTLVSQPYIGFIIDNKLGFYFVSKSDKDYALNYINGKGEDKFIPAFSKFDLKTIQSEVNQRKFNPQLVNQNRSSICGIVCIVYLMIKYQYKQYVNLTYDLYYYAESFYGNNNYLIKPRNSIFGQIYSIGPKDVKYYKMPEADYITLASIKCSENSILSFDGKDDGIMIDGLGSLSTPAELMKLLEKLLKATEIENNTNDTGAFYDEMYYLNLMDLQYNNKNECLMLIDSTMIDSSLGNNFTTNLPWPNHWVMYHGGLEISGDTITFKVSSWGYKKYYPVSVSKERFKNTFYGYIKCKFLS